ncbi:type IV pilus assembly protein PilM [Leucobacter denitrificans]|uniref:Type IV pilus assembly protein PilM n=1 Tax=Leucobacter denitrificans TaxID=683042 RepID=A0A7G9S7D1_9MICO|nr:type IV pilus assembly protein PilM [Leucobacter denitrificans]QNN63756.1 type IV pilus assembly protein PilM [Leucobacter denitrificans]
MAKDVVGLVISSRAVFAAEVEHRRKKLPRLKRVGMVELPENVVSDGEVRDANAVTRVLVQLWEQAGFSSKRVICGIGNQRTLVRNHTVPQMSEAQLSRALRYQVEDMLPVPVTDTILDFYPIAPVEGSVPPQMDGLLIAALKSSVESEAAAVSNAGLKVVGFDLNSFAVLRSVDVGDTLLGTRLIVSLGWRVSHILVVRDRVPQFVRIVPLGVGHIFDALRKMDNEAVARAETLAEYIAIMRRMDTNQDPDLTAAIVPVIEQIRSTVEYYSATYTGEEISSVLLLGYGAIGTSVENLIAEEFDIPVEIGDPIRGVDLTGAEPGELIEEFSQLLSVPVGLALRGR